MGSSAAEKNRRKRERKKKEKQRKHVEHATSENDAATKNEDDDENDVEIEYVAEDVPFDDLAAADDDDANGSSGLPEGLPLPGQGESVRQLQDRQDNSIRHVLQRFHERALVVPTASAVVSDDDNKQREEKEDDGSRGSSDDDDDDEHGLSRRKLREMTRPTVAELKRRVARPDLVEAHDITAADPDFLILLKGVPGTARVPRHWGRKRKYLQGKRGFEKPPFKLPDFIVKTGITEIRDTVAEEEAKQSAKQKNRGRVNPKMGNMDVDYGVLYEAFFKYQTKPTSLTKFGDLYYEGKELETSTDIQPGGPYSKKLLNALGMADSSAAPPWLFNMQRYGPPPSYPHLSIPGLNAPLPSGGSYGYHPGGFGKPSVDAFGRPLYGGNPFDPPGSGKKQDDAKEFVTSDGKTVAKTHWGSLPTGDFQFGRDDEEEESEDESSSQDEDMGESDAEEDTTVADGIASVLPPPTTSAATAPQDLRKQSAGDETPAPDSAPKRLYQVLETKAASDGSTSQQDGVFQSDIQYVVPGGVSQAAAVPEGAESVLSKAVAPGEATARKRKHNADDEDTIDKNFKF
jgi:splicing factor 3B subunit 2